ncbi:unnamed protein product [Heligmosomoides polygyrus]|uniref:Uncharacterized protein n=1 Tax=Heligmosomoides polygyrus TaxID=6339 RepID=A0A183GEG8_HELPZ|nr:unnamed protein product [Heligmosomoides polygyrus]
MKKSASGETFGEINHFLVMKESENVYKRVKGESQRTKGPSLARIMANVKVRCATRPSLPCRRSSPSVTRSTVGVVDELQVGRPCADIGGHYDEPSDMQPNPIGHLSPSLGSGCHQ